MDKLAFNKFCKFLVSKLLSSPSVKWGKEMKIAQKLLKIYEDKVFWENLNLNFNITSLSWFLTNEGRTFLAGELSKQLLEKSLNKTYVIQDKKIGEDIEIKRKMKTLKDFIKE